jgi:hypothetical protein
VAFFSTYGALFLGYALLLFVLVFLLFKHLRLWALLFVLVYVLFVLVLLLFKHLRFWAQPINKKTTTFCYLFFLSTYGAKKEQITKIKQKTVGAKTKT